MFKHNQSVWVRHNVQTIRSAEFQRVTAYTEYTCGRTVAGKGSGMNVKIILDAGPDDLQNIPVTNCLSSVTGIHNEALQETSKTFLAMLVTDKYTSTNNQHQTHHYRTVSIIIRNSSTADGAANQPTTSQLCYIQVLVVCPVLSATSLEGSILLVGDEDPGTPDSCLNCSSVRQGIILAVDTRRMEAFHMKCQRQ